MFCCYRDSMLLSSSGAPLRMSNLPLALLGVQPMEIMQALRHAKDFFGFVRLFGTK